MPRSGTHESPESQVKRVGQWANDLNPDDIIFIDDVVVFGDTFPVIMAQLHEHLNPNISVRFIVGLAASGGVWNGIEKVRDATGTETEYLSKVIASPEIEGGSKGMAIPVSRDLTIFGGRVTSTEDGPTLSHPYILPFSKPLASIMRPDKQIEASLHYLDFNKALIESLEKQTGQKLTIKDLTDNGYGVPYTSMACLQDTMRKPTPDTIITEYIEYALSILAANQEIILEECAV